MLLLSLLEVKTIKLLDFLCRISLSRLLIGKTRGIRSAGIGPTMVNWLLVKEKMSLRLKLVVRMWLYCGTECGYIVIGARRIGLCWIIESGRE